MSDDKKDFPKGFRKLSAEEAAAFLKCRGLDSELANIDRVVADHEARRADLVILREAHGEKLPAGEIFEVGKPELDPETGKPEGPDNSGVWVKE